MKKNFIKIVPREIAILGQTKALAVAYIRGWVATNASNKKAIKFGKVWTYSTIVEWSTGTGVPQATIKRHLSQLEKSGLVITGIYNDNRYDRTKWYRLADDFNQMLYMLEREKFDLEKKQISPKVEADLTFTIDQNDLIEKSNKANQNDSVDPIYKYNKENNKEYINETNTEIDNSGLEETDTNRTIENTVDVKFENKIEAFKLALINFQRKIDRNYSKIIDISINDALNEIVNKYGTNKGINVIYEFVYNDYSAEKGHILQNLIRIKSNINRIC